MKSQGRTVSDLEDKDLAPMAINISGSELSPQEQKVARYYERHTENSYITLWDPDEFHLGIFLEGETVTDYSGRDIETHRRAIRRMTETVVGPAQIRPTDTVVDAGCGVGGTAIHLANRYGCRVIGVNLSGRQIKITEKKIEELGLSEKISFLQGDCSQRLPLDDKSVDVIVNIESACHYSNRDKFINECARILKDNGQLVAQDWVAKDSYAQSEFIAAMCNEWCLQFPLETPSSYSEVLTRNGFRIIDLVDVDGLKQTMELFKKFSTGILKAALASREFTDNQRVWLRQFETITDAYRAGHFSLLIYHARLAREEIH